jgi:formylglycine-generating enzyme required for sulfatase activity
MICVKGRVEFRAGSPHHEARRSWGETPRWRRLSRDFAIASKPVTAELWDRFVADQPPAQRQALTPLTNDTSETEDAQKGKTKDRGLPVVYVTWVAAAQFCNWLSKKEGIPEKEWCYPARMDVGMKMAPRHLNRKGYRLPTASEWEYACRASTTTAHFAGSDAGLVRRYSFSRADSQGRAWPVGQKRPNDLGLFDALGNVFNWCQERSNIDPTTMVVLPFEDVEDLAVVARVQNRRLRGGTYDTLSVRLRSAAEFVGNPGPPRSATYGLRVARTLD